MTVRQHVWITTAAPIPKALETKTGLVIN